MCNLYIVKITYYCPNTVNGTCVLTAIANSMVSELERQKSELMEAETKRKEAVTALNESQWKLSDLETRVKQYMEEKVRLFIVH